MMRFYTQQHRFYCGINLHARTISLCVLDTAGAIVREATIAATPAAVLDALAPFRDGLVVGCECMFAWYGAVGLTGARGGEPAAGVERGTAIPTPTPLGLWPGPRPLDEPPVAGANVNVRSEIRACRRAARPSSQSLTGTAYAEPAF
jgi:hypothetical protein